MKQLLTVLVIWSAVFSGTVTAQQDSLAAAKKEYGLDTKGRSDMLIVNLNHERLMNLSDAANLKFTSRGIDVQMMVDFPLEGGYFSLAPGLGFSSQNYFTDQWLRDTAASGTVYTYADIPDSLNISSYKLSTNFLTLPIELRFRSKPVHKNNRIKAAIGLKIGLLINRHDKFKNDDGDKFKTFVFPDFRTWRFNVTGRIAYGKVGLTGSLSLVSLLNENAGPDLTPVSMGISIIPF